MIPAQTAWRREGTWALYCDGAHSKKRAQSGWGVCVVTPAGTPAVAVGGIIPHAHMDPNDSEGAVTNNVAELKAILYGLKMLRNAIGTNIDLDIISDSTYALGVISGNYSVASNHALVISIRQVVAAFSSVCFLHVRGHRGEVYNEVADTMASLASRCAPDGTMHWQPGNDELTHGTISMLIDVFGLTKIRQGIDRSDTDADRKFFDSATPMMAQVKRDTRRQLWLDGELEFTATSLLYSVTGSIICAETAADDAVSEFKRGAATVQDLNAAIIHSVKTYLPKTLVSKSHKSNFSNNPLCFSTPLHIGENAYYSGDASFLYVNILLLIDAIDFRLHYSYAVCRTSYKATERHEIHDMVIPIQSHAHPSDVDAPDELRRFLKRFEGHTEQIIRAAENVRALFFEALVNDDPSVVDMLASVDAQWKTPSLTMTRYLASRLRLVKA